MLGQGAAPETAADLLAAMFPPLRGLWPNLQSVSAPQTAFLLLDNLEALYGGAAGGGKSDALLAGGLQYVDHPGYAALILRRSFADLALPGAAMARSHEWLNGKARWLDRDKTWTFENGSTLTFGYLEYERDVYRYQSSEFQYIGFDELTQFTEKQFVYLFSRLRRRAGLKVPLRMRAATNPGNIGHGWVLRRFPIRTGERPADRDGRIFVPAKIADNPGLDRDEYAATLGNLDETLRQQLMDGDWGVFEGAAFASFREELHCVPAFPLPAEWLRFESLDHGVANPTACLAWAADYDGNLVTFDSYYAPGLVSAHAAAIAKLRGSVDEPGWWPRDERGWLRQSPVSFADPSMWATTGLVTRLGDPASVVTEYLDNDVDGFVRANNDRKAGRLRLLELLRPDPARPFPSWHPRHGEFGSPRWFIVGRRCPDLVEQLRSAPVNEEPVGQSHGAGEIVDPKWESAHGHCIAGARYGAMSWQEPAERPDVLPEDLREAAVVWMARREFEDEDLDGLGVERVET